MKRMMSIALVAGLLSVGAACGSRNEAKDQVLAAIRRTEGLAYRFEYLDDRPADLVSGETPAQAITVSGLVEDDFRFKALVKVNDQPGFEEVVNDDSLAMRFIDANRLTPLVNKSAVASSDTKTDIEGADSLTVLRSRRWVLDENAAPNVVAGADSDQSLGQDPVLDAVTALQYAEKAVQEAMEVERFNPDDVTPVYTSSEDDFPKPEDGSGVDRYDLRRPKLPPPGQQLGPAAGAGRPQTRHFRRMAIYVKDGRVIQIREVIDLRGKFLKDTLKYARTFAKESGATPQDLADFDQFVNSTSEKDLSTGLLQAMSIALAASGDQPLLVRSMRLDLRDLGGEVKVEPPAGEVVKGGLDFLLVSERGKEQEESEGSEDTASSTSSSAASSSTTTP